MKNRIAEWRQKRRLSLAEVAKSAGTNRQTVHRLERGMQRLTADWMYRLAPAFGIRPADLLDTDTNIPAVTSLAHDPRPRDPEDESLIKSADRLRWARENAGYQTAADFARANEWGRSTYTHYENETRGISPLVAARLAEQLNIDAGWLLTGAGEPRAGMGLSPSAQPAVWAPVISWVQAGQPGSADLNPDADEYIPVSTLSKNIYALQVVGSSMNRIAPSNSRIVVDPEQRAAEDGWAVIARVGDEVTFKRYRDRHGPIRLEPDSTEPHDTLYPAEGFEILGRVIEIVIKP